MKTVLAIAMQNLRLILRDKSAAIWMVVVPCLYIVVFGTAFKGGDSSRAKAALTVLDLDRGLISGRLAASLASDNIELQQVAEKPDEAPIRMLTIPAGFTGRILAGQQDTILYEVRAGANVEAGTTAELAIRRAVYRTLADLAELRLQNRNVQEASLQSLDGRETLIKLRTETAGNRAGIPSGFSGQLPAQIIQFTMLVLFIYSGNMVYEERRSGLIRRTRIAPVSMLQLFLGKLMGSVLIGFCQIAILLILGRLVFGVYLGRSPAGLILLSAAFATAVGAMGLILGFAVRHGEKLTGIAIVSGLAMAALSGCWWPIEITPAWMQKAALFLPSGLALKAYHRLISFGDGLKEVMPYILGEAAFAVVLSLLFAYILNKLRMAEHIV